jgi:membrane protein DedA with SNARE-associated domain
MKFSINKNVIKTIALAMVLIFIAGMAGTLYGYRRGYRHAEAITNKWWIDQKSQYYDASEIIKKQHAKNFDAI